MVVDAIVDFLDDEKLTISSKFTTENTFTVLKRK